MEKLKQLIKELEDAGDAFKVSPSSSTCQAYKSTLALFIEFAKTTPNYTNAELDQFQQVADSVDCSIY
jgi:uncharacterized protein YaaR (DUF327 family)